MLKSCFVGDPENTLSDLTMIQTFGVGFLKNNTDFLGAFFAKREIYLNI